MSSTAELYVWLVLPYASLALFIGGHIWRYRTDQLGWTSRSTQLLESRLLKWGSIFFHFGALAVIAGHVAGILIPMSFTEKIGISERIYHDLAGVGGSVTGSVCVIGLAILIFRRSTVARVRVNTTITDVFVYALLAILIVLGLAEAMGYNLIGPGYNYRLTVGPWFRSLFYNPQPSLMANTPIIYQLHAAIPWLLYALWPFSRLVHVWSIPFQYIGRPYILYRSKAAVARPGRR